MKTRKILALILSVLMIISVIPATVFAVPGAVTVADEAHDHTHDCVEHSELSEDLGEDEDLGENEEYITIIMKDDYGDGWNDASIEVYVDGELLSSYAVPDGLETTEEYIDYNRLSEYVFVWIKGNYDSECSFIILLGEEELLSAEAGTVEYSDGEEFLVIETKCNHSVSEPCGSCSVCDKECGTGFKHKFNEEFTCTICGYVCTHDWSNYDGVCADCGKTCEHTYPEESNMCSVCSYDKSPGFTITMGDDYSDAWNGARLDVYRDGVLWKKLSPPSNVSEITETLDYNSYCTYVFVWVSGSYDDECSFEISLGEESLLSMGVGDVEYADGEEFLVIESKCDHSIAEPGGVCSVCNRKCGTAYKHEFDEEFTCTNCGFECTHDWSNLDGVCADCGKTCEHTYPEGSNICSVCNYDKTPIIVVKMFDDNDDGWSGAEIEVYKDGVFLERLSVPSESSENTEKLDYDSSCEYVFVWVSGPYDYECSFQIYLLNDLLFTSWEGDVQISSGEVIFILESKCEHSITEPCGTCSVCNKKCGTEYRHKFDGESVCTVCEYECTHDWSNHDGVCAVCKIQCSHTFENMICTGCQMNQFACSVTTEDDTVDYYNTWEEALDEAIKKENSTLKLFRKIDLKEFGSDISEGNFAIDLNGFELTSDTYTLRLEGTAKLKICDSSVNQTGKLTTTNVSCSALVSLESSEVTLESGTVFSINLSASGSQTQSKLVVNGGSILPLIEGRTSVMAICHSVIFNGGTISGSIFHKKGTIDFSGHPDPSGICIENFAGEAVPPSVYNLPEGFFFAEEIGGTEVDELSNYKTYYINCSVGRPQNPAELVLGDNVAEIAEDSDGYSYTWTAPNDGKLVLTISTESGNWQYYVANFTTNEYSDVHFSDAPVITPSIIEVSQGDEIGVWVNTYDPEMFFTTPAETVTVTAVFESDPITIDLGEKASETNVRYTEIDGVVTEITEDNDTYTVELGEENLLIEVTEKTAEGEFVNAQYFFVDVEDGSVTKLAMDSYMETYDETSIRTNGYTGIRFKSHILTAPKLEEEQFVIDEYGYIIARADVLGDEELTLVTEKKVVGIGYNKTEDIDIVFDSSDDEMHIFTGVLKNIPVAHYKTELVCKTYTLITVNGEQFVLYGEAVSGNVYDTAKALLHDDPANEELIKIVLDYEKTAGLPGDDLFDK